MPAYTRPNARWFADHLTQVARNANAGAAGGTRYVIEYPKRKTSEPLPTFKEWLGHQQTAKAEHKRGVCMGINGSVEHDHEGRTTGLGGWGQASHHSGSWVNL